MVDNSPLRVRGSRAHSIASRRTLREVAAVGWLILIAVALLAPALAHGSSLGPYDILSQFGLTNNPHVGVHNLVNSDEIQEFIPWQALAWLQVHAGHLPLWNPFSMLGLPLAFNFQSAPFGPTVAIGYLFPLSLAHSATVVARLIIAGSGAYLFARVLRLGIVPALIVATIFELCGAFSVWLGDYPAGAMAWLGWILACSVLVLRGRRRVVSVGLLALTLAFAFLEGEPQIAAVVVGVVMVFALVMATDLRRSRSPRAAWSALLDHGLGLVAATALVAPIYLPGIQLSLAGSRSIGPPISGLPLYDLSHLLFSDYNGLPTSLATVIGPDNLYVSMLYVGTIALVLAVTSLALWRQRREVVALTLAATILLVLLFASPVLSLLHHVPLLNVFRLQLATTALDFCVAVLAGFGAHALLAQRGQRLVETWYRVGIALLACCLLVFGALLIFNVSHLPTPMWNLRRGSFFWPLVGLGAGALVLFTRWLTGRRAVLDPQSRVARRRSRSSRAGLVEIWALLLVETAFLLSAGVGIVSSSPGYLPTNNAVTSLQRIVGSSLVGFGRCAANAFPSTGLVPDINLAYGVSEFAAYDPILPRSYHASYGAATGTSAKLLAPYGLFCPAITSASLARLYGVSYIIEPPGVPGPSGTRLVAKLLGEGLFAVPGSGRVTLVALDSKGPAVVQPSSQPSPSTWRIEVTAKRPSLLQLRISNVPGWQAEINGRPLQLTSFDHAMLQAAVPSGNYVVTLRYWPKTLSIGLILCAAATLTLVGALIIAGLWTRRSRHHSRAELSSRS
ncbi:MAG: YfhO family protein [Acidimicrobiaceae bacterium]|nr:YfhO family protein [Acidimicrobiaceae bacterium]